MTDATPLGIIYDMPAEQYHAIEAVSASGLRLFARSPWHFHNRVPVTPTRPMLRGTLAHCAVLEPGAMEQRYIVTPPDAPRRPTKSQWQAKKPSEESQAAMDWWTEFHRKCEGREIITAEEFETTQAQLRAIALEPELAGPLKSGRAEVSVFWIDPGTGLYCKARPDWVHDVSDREVMLLDLKSTADESPNGFGRAAARMKYHLQMAHYTEGYEIASGGKVAQFIFGAVTNTPPVLAVPYRLTDEIEAQAYDERRELLERFAWCRNEGKWPAYGQGTQLLDFPAYAKRSNELEVSFVD